MPQNMPQEFWWYLGSFTVLQIVVWLVFMRIILKSMKKKEQENHAKDRETKLFKLYQEIEGMMDVFEEYIDEVREDIEKERSELAEMSRHAAALYVKAVDRPQPSQESIPAPPLDIPKIVRPVRGEEKKPNPGLTPNDRDSLRKFTTKSQKVRFLMSRGLSLEDVARELDIGKGEVKLIAELQK